MSHLCQQESFEAVQNIGLTEFLDADPRPTFIVALEDARHRQTQSLQLAFVNDSLQKHEELVRLLVSFRDGKELEQGGTGKWESFRRWIAGIDKDKDKNVCGLPSSRIYKEILWTKFTVHGEWVIITSNGGESSPTAGEKRLGMEFEPHTPELRPFQNNGSGQSVEPMDTLMKPKPSLAQGWWASFGSIRQPSAHWSTILSTDWASTRLGPMDTWSARLRQMCKLVMADSRPVCLFWGPDGTVIYNEAYCAIAGGKHPGILGTAWYDAWSEVREILGAAFDAAKSTGHATVHDEWPLILERHGYPEETYFAWSVIPVIDEDGSVAGFLNPSSETTVLRLAERRTTTLLKLSECIATAKGMDTFWTSILEGLSSANEHDIPVAALYSIKEDVNVDNIPSSSSENASSFQICHLEGSLGIPEGHIAAIPRLDLRNTTEGLGPLFQEAMRQAKPIFLRIEDGTLPPTLLKGVGWLGLGDVCKTGVVCPIRPTNGESTMGFLFIGLNPRTPYDENYQRFVSLLTRQLATSLASIVLFEEEVRSGRNAAEQSARNQAQLSEKLDETVQQFQMFAEVVPCGLARATPVGIVTYANDRWYDITKFPRDAPPTLSPLQCVHEDDRSSMETVWLRLITDGDAATFSFRIKENDSEKHLTSEDDATCILGSALTEKDEDGNVKIVTWCLTDISDQKRTAEEALHRAQLAEKLSAQLSRFYRMVELASVGMFSIDASGCLIEANSTWFEITGFTKDDPVLRTPGGFRGCIHADHLPRMDEEWDSLTVAGTPVSFELKLKKPSMDLKRKEHMTGQCWILAAAIPEKSEDGHVLNVTGCITDISFQKRSVQDALERAQISEQLLKFRADAESSEQKFAKFAKSAPVGIFSLAPNGDYLYCNDKWFDILQIPKGQGKLSWMSTSRDLWYDADMQAILDTWNVLVVQKQPTTLECRLKRPWKSKNASDTEGQSQAWVALSAYPELADDGSVRCVMGCLSDISHFKWAEELQKRGMEEAIAAKRSQEQFIDMTSHEIRNPLSAVIQCSDAIMLTLEETKPLLTDEALRKANTSCIENATIIVSCALHQKRIVDDILTLSKLDSKLLQIAPMTVEPTKLVQDALKMFEAEAQRADVQIKLEVDKSLTAMKIESLIVDPSRLLQVLINLLTNAIKFTKTEPRREVTIHLATFAERPPDMFQSVDYIPTRTFGDDTTLGSGWGTGDPVYVHLAVHDTGRGLDDVEKKLLFLRFSQASPKTHVQYGGSGLGLFISRELTELQGGEIGVASQSGVGSIFAFFVKARRARKPTNQTQINRTSVHAITGWTPASLHILIVEDNLINQKVLSKQLRQLGSTVHVANHGGEALTFLKTSRLWKGQAASGTPLSIILMDVEMPVMDGLECARTIRALQRDGSIRDHVPIIAVSANARGEQQVQAKAAGMDDVVTKPFRIPELIPIMERLVST